MGTGNALFSGNIGIGTATPSARLDIRQTTNGTVSLFGQRATDVAPTGDFITYKNAAGNTTLFRVDNSGNIFAGGISNSGALTITSTSTPQFRVQYDSNNEATVSVSSAGVATHAFNGTAPKGIFIPQSNAVDTFQFQNSTAVPILSVDTQNQRVGIGIGTVQNKLTISDGGTPFSGGTNRFVQLFTNSVNPVELGLGNTRNLFALRFTTDGVSASQQRIGFVTGGNLEGLIMDGNGNVGIGATAPTTKTQITADSAGYGETTQAQLSITGSTDTNKRLALGFNTTDNVGWIQSVQFGTSVKPLALQPNGGNVGIGTVNPGAKLDVMAITGGGFGLKVSNAGSTGNVLANFNSSNDPQLNINSRTGGNIGYLYFNDSSGNLLMQIGQTFAGGQSLSAVNNFQIGIDSNNTGTGAFDIAKGNTYLGRVGDGTSLLRILNNGNVGIGATVITNPAGFNHVVQIAGSGAQILSFSTSTSTARQWDIGVNDSAGTGSQDFDIYDATTAAHRLVVKGSSGNIGIGTTAPNANLHVLSAGNTRVRIEAGTGSIALLDFDRGAVSNGQISVDASNNMLFHSGASLSFQPLTLNGTTGNVGIGTTGPQDKLDVQGGNIRNSALSSVGNRCVYADSNGTLHIKSDDCGLAGASGDNLGNHIATQNIQLNNNWLSNDGGSEGIRVDNTGNVGVGVAGSTYQLEVASNIGITASEVAGTNPTLVIRDNSAAQTRVSAVNFNNSSDTTRGQINYIQSTGTMGFNTAGARAVTILSSGNVGIGTSNPGDLLHVLKAQNAITNIQVQNTTAGAAAQAAFLAKSDTSNLYIGAHSSTFGTRPGIGFIDAQTNNDLALMTNDTERITIQAGGNVGIGTTGPLAKLSVGGGSISDANLPIQISAAGAIAYFGANRSDGAYGGLFGWDTAFSGVTVRSVNSADSLSLVVNGNTRALTITPTAGNVGIGTTSPQTKLHVSSVGSNGTLTDNILSEVTGSFTAANRVGLGSLIAFRNDTGTSYAKIGAYCPSDCTNNQSQLGFWTENTATTFTTANAKLVIDPTGNVGIGVTNPNQPLTVQTNGSEQAIKIIGRSGGGNGGQLQFYTSDGVTLQAQLYSESTGGTGLLTNTAMPLQLGTNGAINVTILSGGSVGIGKTNPSTLLDVNGTVTATNFADLTGGYNVNLGSTGSEGRGVVAGYSGGAYSGIGYNIRHTASSSVYVAPGTDTTSYILFNAGGFNFQGAPGGAAGRTLSLSTLFAISGAGAVTGGTYNGQTISSAANFTGTLNVNGAISGNSKEIFLTTDTYLRINQSNTFSSGIWMGNSNFMGGSGILAMGSNGGTTNSRVYINGGSFNGANVIAIDGSNGNVSATQFNGSGAGLSGTASSLTAGALTNFVNQSGSRFGTDFNSLLQTGFYNASAVFLPIRQDQLVTDRLSLQKE
jgi:hypothetical protein